jgi:hypothetical protein
MPGALQTSIAVVWIYLITYSVVTLLFEVLFKRSWETESFIDFLSKRGFLPLEYSVHTSYTLEMKIPKKKKKKRAKPIMCRKRAEYRVS